MPETNGPPEAQRFRERNPQIKPQEPKRLTRKTQIEMMVGRMQSKLCWHAPLKDQLRHQEWINDFIRRNT